jgi:hypothetical protein
LAPTSSPLQYEFSPILKKSLKFDFNFLFLVL